MYSLVTFVALFGSTVSSQDIPPSLPSNETALYPPYKFTVPVYTPAQQGIPTTLNASKRPGSVEPTTKVAPPELVADYSDGGGVTSVVTASGNSILSGSVSNTWVYGNAYTPAGATTGSHQSGTTYTTPRPASLLSGGKYLALAAPTYQEYDVSHFINVKQVADFPVYGDGSTDDTYNLNSNIFTYAGCMILFLPQGVYVITNTLFFPAGSIAVGEARSKISASGSNFMNQNFPIPIVKVGNTNVLPGCILVEVNAAGNSPGDFGFWNSHFRVGGAADTLVETTAACGSNPTGAMAAFMLLHLTSTSSVYIEHMWGWTADRDLDGVSIAGRSAISTRRGLLVEATQTTWLHGVAFEHNTLYQFNFNNAQNVYVGMQQSETPYWQGAGSPDLALVPWTPVNTYGHLPSRIARPAMLNAAWRGSASWTHARTSSFTDRRSGLSITGTLAGIQGMIRGARARIVRLTRWMCRILGLCIGQLKYACQCEYADE
ncbi:hypothetical protein MMC08_003617 [Hypocenomyce scalaris]|nr:hypothetical protein [Hypocenomyce scalaris]